MDVPVDYYVWGTMLKHYQRHAKSGHRNAEIKDHFVDDTEWFVSRIIDKAIVSFCNRFQSCVAATSGHWYWDQSV